MLPYHFDTTSVWHTILKGAAALNAVMLVGIVIKLLTGEWPTVAGLIVVEAIVLGFTWLFVRFQSGSIGTLYRDRVEVAPNAMLGIPLPGQSSGPHELVWLAGQTGTPDILIARTEKGAGRTVGAELARLLELPLEERNPPRIIKI